MTAVVVASGRASKLAHCLFMERRVTGGRDLQIIIAYTFPSDMQLLQRD